MKRDILGRNHYLATLELYGEIAEIFHQCSTELPEQIDGLLEILDETVRQAYNLRLKEGLDVPELPSLSRKVVISILSFFMLTMMLTSPTGYKYA